MTHQQADYLKIPLLDGRHGIAQIFEIDESRPGVVFLGLSDRIAPSSGEVSAFRLDEVVGFAFAADTLITTGQWEIAGFDQIPLYRAVFDYDRAERSDFADYPVHDPAVVEAFVNAVHGLYPWDSFGPLFDQIKRTDIDLSTVSQAGAS